MGLYKSIKTNDKLEQEGIWLHVGGTRIRLARAGGKNTKFITAVEKVARENKRALEFMNESSSRKLYFKLYAEHVVLDWLTEDAKGTLDEMGQATAEDNFEGERYVRGISGPDDVVVDFNKENVLKTFDDLPDLFIMIKQTAEDPSLYRQELLDGVSGN